MTNLPRHTSIEGIIAAGLLLTLLFGAGGGPQTVSSATTKAATGCQAVPSHRLCGDLKRPT